MPASTTKQPKSTSQSKRSAIQLGLEQAANLQNDIWAFSDPKAVGLPRIPEGRHKCGSMDLETFAETALRHAFDRHEATVCNLTYSEPTSVTDCLILFSMATYKLEVSKDFEGGVPKDEREAERMRNAALKWLDANEPGLAGLLRSACGWTAPLRSPDATDARAAFQEALLAAAGQ